MFNRDGSKPNFLYFTIFLEKILEILVLVPKRNVPNKYCGLEIFRFLWLGCRFKIHYIGCVDVFFEVFEFATLLFREKSSDGLLLCCVLASLLEEG